MAINHLPVRRARERRIYIAAAIAFPLIVLAGFGRTYYLKGFFDVPAVPTLLHLHGIVMTAWVLLFVTQVWLISARRVRLHQKLGYAGIALAVLVVAVGGAAGLTVAKYGSAFTPPSLQFLIIPLGDLVVFAIIFGAAVYLRKKPAEHKRLMLLTAIGFLPPAIARIPIEQLQQVGPPWFFGLPSLIMIAVIVLDRLQNGKFNRVFIAGAVLMIASYVVRIAVMESGPWLAVAGWLTSFVP